MTDSFASRRWLPIAVVALLIAGVLGYRYWASDERQIARLLDNVADAVGQAEGEAGVTRVSPADR